MKLTPPIIPKKYRPKGIDLLHEDQDLIVGSKAPGILTVAALWEKENTIHNILNSYVQKGNSRSRKCVYVVHRLDQATSGVLVFAKSEKAQQFLKNDWMNTQKIYYAIVHGQPKSKHGLIESHLEEDEDYVVRSTQDLAKGKLARTEYEVIKSTPHFSVLKINLLTGKKNQIRVHLSELGHPIAGDEKYGQKGARHHRLMLHAFSISFNHPHLPAQKTQHERLYIEAPIPPEFFKLVDFST